MIETKLNYIGSINLGCEVICSDPCYTDYGIDSDINTYIKNVKRGIYNAYYETMQLKGWGNRISSIIVFNAMYEDGIYKEIDTTDFEWYGDCCVDSGTCGIFDYDYYDDTHDDEDYHNEWYDIYICKLLDKVALFEGNSICSSSGLGDGCYGVYVKYDDKGKVIAIQIKYIDKDDEEENEY